jgi:prophage regulatory protein
MGLPETGFVREWDIIGDPKAVPPIPPVIPIGRSSWQAGVRSGRFPKPVKLGPRTSAWRVEDIRDLVAKLSLQGTPLTTETMAPGIEAVPTPKLDPSKDLPQPRRLLNSQSSPPNAEPGPPLNPINAPSKTRRERR